MKFRRESPVVPAISRGLGFTRLGFGRLGFRRLRLGSIARRRGVGVVGLLLVAGVAGALVGIDGPGIDGSVPAASAGPPSAGPPSAGPPSAGLAASGGGWQGGAWPSPAQGVASGCSAAAGTFSDDFTIDTHLDRDCWSRSGTLLREVARRIDASFECPQLVFSDGMEMTSGGTGTPEFSGIQSRHSYLAPFQFETTVSGTESGDSAFSVYMVGTGGTGSVSVEGNLAPGNGPGYGLWANQGSLPAGTGFPGSEESHRGAGRGH